MRTVVDEQNVDIWIVPQKAFDASLGKVFGFVVNDDGCDIFELTIPCFCSHLIYPDGVLSEKADSLSDKLLDVITDFYKR